MTEKYEYLNSKIISMAECLSVLDEMNVGYWSYGEEQNPEHRILPFGKKVILWGVNEASKFFIKIQTNIEVNCILDKDSKKSETVFEGIEVFQPEIFGSLKDCFILIMCNDKYKDKFENVWHSLFARLIRLSIVNQTYSFCNPYTCPYDLNQSNHLEGKLNSENYMMDCDSYPRTLSVSHDSSCNLFCESCRRKIYVAQKERLERANFISDRVIEVLPYISEIIMGGNGEIFVSQAYRKIWEFPIPSKINDQTFVIFTNGKLFRKENWDKLYHNNQDKNLFLIVSIDAATKNTYEKLRRGGNWERLIHNLKFAEKLRKENKLKRFTLDFVVQRKDIDEMYMFVQMTKSLGVDRVDFTAIANWGSYEADQFNSISVLDEQGYVKSEFIEIMKNPILKDKIVNLGNLHIKDGGMQ